jgi:hypothetical protein
MNDTTAGLLKTAPVDWDDRVNRILTKGPGIEHLPTLKNRCGLAEVIAELDMHIEGAARLRGYLEERYGSGCGDQGHAAGVKESSRLVTKVRRALGYSYPIGEVNF